MVHACTWYPWVALVARAVPLHRTNSWPFPIVTHVPTRKISGHLWGWTLHLLRQPTNRGFRRATRNVNCHFLSPSNYALSPLCAFPFTRSFFFFFFFWCRWRNDSLVDWNLTRKSDWTIVILINSFFRTEIYVVQRKKNSVFREKWLCGFWIFEFSTRVKFE